MIAQGNKGLDFLKSIRDGSFKLGLGIDCLLDDHLRFKKGTFNVMAGHANVGKTKFILYYYLCLSVKHGLKWVVFSSENSVGGQKRDLIQLHSGKKIEDMDDITFQYHFEWVNEHFKFIDFEEFYRVEKRFMNFRDVFKTALEECKDFDALVIDPYNSLAECEDIKGNKHERDYQVASEFRMFCRQNKKTVYLLAHGNTEALRKQFGKGHDFEGHPIPLMAADIEGGGKWVNRADDFVVIHRLTQHESEWMNTEVHVKKVKETETGGKTTFMDNPIIFKLNHDMLSFVCYQRGVASNPTNPLEDQKEKPQQPTTKEINKAIQTNTEVSKEKKERDYTQIKTVKHWQETEKDDLFFHKEEWD